MNVRFSLRLTSGNDSDRRWCLGLIIYFYLGTDYYRIFLNDAHQWENAEG